MHRASFKLLKNKLPAVTAGLVLGLLFSLAHRVDAANGFSYISSCACKTTADFSNAAAAASGTPQKSGLYTVISSSTAETAFVSVRGEIKTIHGGGHGWQVLSTTPVDASGNSLAGQTESAQEDEYGAIDLQLMMAQRSSDFPIIGDLNLPGFFSTDDYAISAAYFNSLGNLVQDLNGNTMVTLTWNDGSGIVAVYQVVWLGTDHTKVANFALKFISATQHGKPITRAGVPIPNPNNSGAGGGGATLPGYYANSGVTWIFAGNPICYASGSIDFGDGPETIGGYVPC